MRKLIMGLILLKIWTYTVGTLTDFEECSQCVHRVIMNVHGHRKEPDYIMVLSIRCVILGMDNQMSAIIHQNTLCIQLLKLNS
ncbi:hypothetical protein AAY473_003213 [Plecturocebus cupreus]